MTSKLYCNKAVMLAALLLVSPAFALANQPVAVSSETTNTSESTTTINVNENIVKVSGRLSLGLLTAEANELVYDSASGAKASHLTWESDTVAMLGFGGSITPVHWLKLNADFKINVSEGSSTMDDYDWFVTGADWTHWSHHEDTDVDSITMFDINAEFTMMGKDQTRLYGIVGYKQDTFEWSAYGGTYVYSVNGFRDSSGSFPDGEKGISYEQTYKTPYLGLGFEMDFTPVTFAGRFTYSPAVDLATVDNHYQRNLEFTDDFETGDMFGLDVAVVYALTTNLKLAGSLHYLSYDEVKGSTNVKDTISGYTVHYDGDVAGSDNTSTLIAATLIYEL